MPKATYIHTTKDAVSTDKKFRPEDDRLYAKEKQEFQGSEKGKQAESRSEQEFIAEQDENTTDKDKNTED